ncbi:MAG: hypothetical protein IJA07_01905 [Agathobacter sp.]|nr:hypothetical protein [Agathobacter sp.]
MLNVSKELKEAFLSAEQKNLVLTFDDGTVIDNEDIASESMELEQTLCDSDELKFGKVSSACFKTKIAASTKRYKNLWFNASIGVGEYEIQLGRFKVYTDNMTSDRLYREIVAYDSLFWATNTDVTEWYNGLAFPISQKDFRDSLFAYLGIEQESVELPNDSILFHRTVNVENLTGLTVLQKLCELNAAWGVINNAGKFKYVHMRTHEHDALYPSDDLYPSDNVYPDDIYDDRLSKADYYQGSLTYEEFDVQSISKVTIREDSEDAGYSYGVDGNTCVVEGNFLLYGATAATLQTVTKNFYEYASYLDYTPSQLKCKGAPWREVGDLLRVIADKRVLTVPILNRQLNGITALNDTYIARGTETCGEVKNSPTEQLKQLQSKTNKLTRTLDETKSEIQKFETDVNGQLNSMSSTISQTAEKISFDVSKSLENYSTKEEMNSAIQVKADKISLEVGKKVGNNEVISAINQTAENISIDASKIDLRGAVTANNYFKINEDGSMESTGGKIANWDIKSDYLGSYGEAADTLFLSQNGKNAYINALNASKDCNIYAKGNFAVDTTGVAYMTNANISGVLTAGKGSSLGGFTVDEDSLFSGKWGTNTMPDVFMCTGAPGSYYVGDELVTGLAFGAGEKFGVTKNGALYSTSGNIGGFDINGSYLGGAANTGGYVVAFYPKGTPLDGTTFFLVIYKDSVYGDAVGGICLSGWRTL